MLTCKKLEQWAAFDTDKLRNVGFIQMADLKIILYYGYITTKKILIMKDWVKCLR